MDEKPRTLRRRGPVEGYDSELDYSAIWSSASAVRRHDAVALLVMWWMSDVFKRQGKRRILRPRPSPRRADPFPPAAVQPRPRGHGRDAPRDREALTTYGWVDRAGGWRAFRSSAR